MITDNLIRYVTLLFIFIKDFINTKILNLGQMP